MDFINSYNIHTVNIDFRVSFQSSGHVRISRRYPVVTEYILTTSKETDGTLKQISYLIPSNVLAKVRM